MDDDWGRTATLHRRAGLGLRPDEVDDAARAGADATLDRLVEGPQAPPADDPWEGLPLDPRDGGRGEAIRAWLRHLVTTDDALRARWTWKLHGWLTSSLAVVNAPDAMVDQIRLLRDLGLGPYPELLRTITTDRAMLRYLDGATSTGREPNENYARELMELFALGVGNYTEDDVRGAARALTGWTVDRRDREVVFRPARHDDTPQVVLGRSGVSDVDGVIDAVVDAPAHAPFVARRVTSEYLGDPDVLVESVAHLADVYESSGRRLDTTVVEALRLLRGGTSTRIVLGPIDWLVLAVRTLAPDLRRALREPGTIQRMGQVPMLPPNVAGWPGGTAWFTSSSIVARTNTADALVAATADDAPALVAAADRDLDRLAQLLVLPEPFGATTAAALRAAADPHERLVLALVSPENLLA